MLTNQASRPSRRMALGFASGLLASALLSRRALAAAPRFVVKDMRTIEPNSVRFAAAQGTGEMPNVALFGGTPEVWQKVKGAVTQSEAQGYPVRAVFIGPPSAAPGLEIFAKGLLVSKPISPAAISQERLIALLRDIHHEFYR